MPGRQAAYKSLDETTRVAGPRLATSEGIATTGADCAIVTACDKDAAHCKNVLEGSAVDADLQHAAIKPVLQSIVMPEDQSRRSLGIDRTGG
jgi:hypothetical protein